MSIIAFKRTSGRILTDVEPRAGKTLDEVVAALNDGGYVELCGDGIIILNKDGNVVGVGSEIQSDAGPDADSEFTIEERD